MSEQKFDARPKRFSAHQMAEDWLVFQESCTEINEGTLESLATQFQDAYAAGQTAANGPTCHKCGKLVETGDVLCSEHEQEIIEALVAKRAPATGQLSEEQVWKICKATQGVPIDHHKGENCPRCDAIENALR